MLQQQQTIMLLKQFLKNEFNRQKVDDEVDKQKNDDNE